MTSQRRAVRYRRATLSLQTEGVYQLVCAALGLFDDLPRPSVHVDHSDGADNVVAAEPSLLTTCRNADLFVKLATICRDWYHTSLAPFRDRAEMSAICRLHSLVFDWDGEFAALGGYMFFALELALGGPPHPQLIAAENEWAPLSHDGTVWWNAVDGAVCTMGE